MYLIYYWVFMFWSSFFNSSYLQYSRKRMEGAWQRIPNVTQCARSQATRDTQHMPNVLITKPIEAVSPRNFSELSSTTVCRPTEMCYCSVISLGISDKNTQFTQHFKAITKYSMTSIHSIFCSHSYDTVYRFPLLIFTTLNSPR